VIVPVLIAAWNLSTNSTPCGIDTEFFSGRAVDAEATATVRSTKV
jgi:hypothetical protein